MVVWVVLMKVSKKAIKRITEEDALKKCLEHYICPKCAKELSVKHDDEKDAENAYCYKYKCKNCKFKLTKYSAEYLECDYE